MKKLFTLIIILFGCVTLMAENTPVGYWKTIDDESGEAKSVVKIYEKNQKLYGKIVKLFRDENENQNPVCAEGSGDLSGKPIIGAVILRGLENDGEWWDHGKITDPQRGKTYNCKIRLRDKGKKLQVRGYIKALIEIGRSQVWIKSEKPHKNQG